jgi:AbiV family abortive infection protein
LAVFENAERLYYEATVLAAAKAFSRALFLHQISMEKLAKVGSGLLRVHARTSILAPCSSHTKGGTSLAASSAGRPPE